VSYLKGQNIEDLKKQVDETKGETQVKYEEQSEAVALSKFKFHVYKTDEIFATLGALCVFESSNNEKSLRCLTSLHGQTHFYDNIMLRFPFNEFLGLKIDGKDEMKSASGDVVSIRLDKWINQVESKENCSNCGDCKLCRTRYIFQTIPCPKGFVNFDDLKDKQEVLIHVDTKTTIPATFSEKIANGYVSKYFHKYISTIIVKPENLEQVKEGISGAMVTTKTGMCLGTVIGKATVSDTVGKVYITPVRRLQDYFSCKLSVASSSSFGV